MKNLFFALVLVFATAAVTAAVIIWLISNSKLSTLLPDRQAGSSQSPLAAERKIVNSLDKFQPGLEKLNDFYFSYSNLTAAYFFEVVLKGKLKTITSDSLVLASDPTSDRSEEIILTLDSRQNFPGFLQSGESSGRSVPLKPTDLKPGDNLRIQLRLDPFTAKTTVVLVVRTE